MKIPEDLKIAIHEPDPPPRYRAKRRGEILHRVLALYGKGRDLEEIVLWALNLEGESPSDWDLEGELLEPMRRLLRDPKAGPLIEAEGMAEVEVVDARGKTHRIDKLVLGEGEVHVIEFKVSRPEEAHREQLRLYLDLLGEIFPGKRRKGWLIYVEQPLVEEVL